MNDETEIHDVDDPRSRRREVLQVLRSTDDQFHPPLSRRGASDGFHGEGGLEAYVDDVLDEELLLAEIQGGTVGIMVYRAGHTAEHLDGPGTYVRTVAVEPEHQGEGVGRELYRALFETVDPDVVSTKTWETNTRHISLLQDLGFQEVAREPDQRPGDVDTVYLALER